MRLLPYANLSPRLVQPLEEAGHSVVHVADLGLQTADDSAILDRSEQDGFVLTADTDFPMLVALRGATRPSMVLLRGVAELPPEVHAQLLLTNLPPIAVDIERGAVATLTPSRVRVRDLPIE